MAVKKFLLVLKTCVQIKIALDSFMVFNYSPHTFEQFYTALVQKRRYLEFGKRRDRYKD